MIQQIETQAKHGVSGGGQQFSNLQVAIYKQLNTVAIGWSD